MEIENSKINTRIQEFDPHELVLLKTNARYMRHEMFQQLVENIRQDGKLTQLPFAVLEDGRYKVLSGNHRVKASMEAGLETIEVIVTDDQLSKDRQTAIQISHNSISGEDDLTILKDIYESIEDIDMRIYSGLDDKTLELLENVKPESMSEFSLDFQTLNFMFLPTEIDRIKTIMDTVNSMKTGQEDWLVNYKEYDEFLDTMDIVSTAYDVKNQSVTLMIMLEMVNRHLVELKDGWFDPDKESFKEQRKKWVPLASILGKDRVPPTSAAIIAKAVKRMQDKQEVTNENVWQAIEYWAADYLAGE